MGFEVKSQSSAGTGEEFILQAEEKEEPGLSPGEKRERLDKAGSRMKGFADTRLQVWLFPPPFPNAQMPSTDRFPGPLHRQAVHGHRSHPFTETKHRLTEPQNILSWKGPTRTTKVLHRTTRKTFGAFRGE